MTRDRLNTLAMIALAFILALVAVGLRPSVFGWPESIPSIILGAASGLLCLYAFARKA